MPGMIRHPFEQTIQDAQQISHSTILLSTKFFFMFFMVKVFFKHNGRRYRTYTCRAIASTK